MLLSKCNSVTRSVGLIVYNKCLSRLILSTGECKFTFTKSNFHHENVQCIFLETYLMIRRITNTFLTINKKSTLLSWILHTEFDTVLRHQL